MKNLLVIAIALTALASCGGGPDSEAGTPPFASPGAGTPPFASPGAGTPPFPFPAPASSPASTL